jgi:voltage-gated potassium channel
MLKKFWRDLSIIFSAIWINLILFAGLMILAAILLRLFGHNPQAGWPQLFLDAFHLAIIERVDTAGRLVPILLAFILPMVTALILGEGVLRVFTIYSQRRVNRKEWDLMVVKSFRNHIVMCGVGEMGKQLLRQFAGDQSQAGIVLVDPRPGIVAEMGLSHSLVIHLQGDMADVEILKQANISSAKMVILTAGEDALNLEAAYKIQKINPDVPIWIRLHHSGLAELLDLSRKPQIHFFCPYQQAAEAIVSDIMEREKIV